MSPSIPTAEDIANWSYDEMKRVASCLASALSKYKQPYTAPLSDSLIALAVGESTIIPRWKTTDPLHGVKKTARKRAKDETLNWSARTTNHGIKVTRVS